MTVVIEQSVTQADALPPGVACYVDGISTQGRVEGWLVNNNSPDERAEIRVLALGEPIAVGPADQERRDVRRAGHGDGFCGFSFDLPNRVFDGATHILEILCDLTSLGLIQLGEITCILSSLPNPRNTNGSPFTDGSDGSLARPEQMKVREIRTDYVENSLVAALARISELDHRNRLLTTECAALREQLTLISNRITHDLNDYARGPSFDQIFNYLSSIVGSTSITRRRDMWLRELTDLEVSGPIFGVFPHDGAAGEFAILVWGSGGIGDALYLSTVVRELFLLFRCRPFVLHENRRAAEVFENNPYVSGTIWLEGDDLRRFVQTVHALDVFDLVADVRYVVTYTTPPLSRIPKDFIYSASYRSAEWQRFVRHKWPELNNLLANEVMARGLGKLSLVGMSSLLPINETSEIDYFIHASAPELAHNLIGVSYVTIHNGADRKMATVSGTQTKNLPITTWQNVASILRAAGFAVVQLGEAHEDLVPEVNVDLRGQTSLEQTAYIIKAASVHIDTEGGLVHLARAVHTRSVVAFGPTPAGFFGYPQNVNIDPPICGNCWWVNERWSTSCPRGLDLPECMTAHSADVIAKNAIDIAKRARGFTITRLDFIAAENARANWNRVISEVASQNGRGAILVGRNENIDIIAGLISPVGEVTYFVDAERLHFMEGHCSPGCVLPYSDASVPRNQQTFDWITAIGLDTEDAASAVLCSELVRCMRLHGDMIISLHAQHRTAFERFAERLTSMQSWRIGAQDSWQISASLMSRLRDESEDGYVAFAYVTERTDAAGLTADGESLSAEPAKTIISNRANGDRSKPFDAVEEPDRLNSFSFHPDELRDTLEETRDGVDVEVAVETVAAKDDIKPSLSREIVSSPVPTRSTRRSQTRTRKRAD